MKSPLRTKKVHKIIKTDRRLYETDGWYIFLRANYCSYTASKHPGQGAKTNAERETGRCQTVLCFPLKQKHPVHAHAAYQATRFSIANHLRYPVDEAAVPNLYLLVVLLHIQLKVQPLIVIVICML